MSDKDFQFEPIALPADDYRGPAQGVGTEHGDSWRVAGKKINAALSHLFGRNVSAKRGPQVVDDGAEQDRDHRVSDLETRLSSLERMVDQLRGAGSGFGGHAGNPSSVTSADTGPAYAMSTAGLEQLFSEPRPVADTTDGHKAGEVGNQDGERYIVSGATGNVARQDPDGFGTGGADPVEPPADEAAREAGQSTAPNPGAVADGVQSPTDRGEDATDPDGGANPVRAGVTPPDPAATFGGMHEEPEPTVQADQTPAPVGGEAELTEAQRAEAVTGATEAGKTEDGTPTASTNDATRAVGSEGFAALVEAELKLDENDATGSDPVDAVDPAPAPAPAPAAPKSTKAK